MTKTLDRIQTLVAHNEVRVSLHGSEELAADDVQVRDVIAGVATAVMVEDYPDYPKGRCCLVLQPGCGESPGSCSLGYSLRTGVACCCRHGIQTRPLAMGPVVAKEAEVSVRSIMQFVRGGAFAAEVNVEIVEEERGWAPYLSLQDAYKLDDVRDALRAGDVDRASRLADRVYRLTPVDVSGETTGRTDDVNRIV